MNKFPLRNLLVVGAETIVGQQCCRLFSHLGYDVLAAAPEPIPSLNVPQILLDVCNEESVPDAIRLAVETFGAFSTLINVSGLEDLTGRNNDLAQIQRQLEKRFLSTVRICRAILPSMQSKGGGLIIQAGGLAPRPRNLELVDIYQAVQFSINHVSEQLNADLREHNIQIINLEHQKKPTINSVDEWTSRDCWAPKERSGTFAGLLPWLTGSVNVQTDAEILILQTIAEAMRQYDPNAYDARLGVLNRFAPPHLGMTLNAFQKAYGQPHAFQDSYVQCKQN